MESSGTPGRSPDLSKEAAKAVAQARAAAAARLREAARAAAQRSPATVTPAAAAASPTRKAKADLQELPSVAGEVQATPRDPPPIQQAQIVVSLEPSPPAAAGPELSKLLLPGAGIAAPEAVVTVPAPSQASQRSPAPQGATQLLPVTRPTHERITEKTRSIPPATGPAEVPPLLRKMTTRRPGDPEADRRTELVEVLNLRSEPRPEKSLLPAILLLLTLVAIVASIRPLLSLRNAAHRPVPVVQRTDPAMILGQIDRSMDLEDWHTALQLAAEGLKVYPDNMALMDRRRRAEAEMRNQFRYDSYRAAATRHNDEAALALFAELPDDSIYKTKATKEAQEIRDTYIATRLAEARAARRLNLCKEVRRLARAVLAVDDTNDEARTLDGKCTSEGRSHKGAKDGSNEGSTADRNLRNPFL